MNSRSWWSSLHFPELWPDNHPAEAREKAPVECNGSIVLARSALACFNLISLTFGISLFTSFPGYEGLRRFRVAQAMCLWVTQWVKPSPCHLLLFHMVWSRQVVFMEQEQMTQVVKGCDCHWQTWASLCSMVTDLFTWGLQTWIDLAWDPVSVDRLT